MEGKAHAAGAFWKCWSPERRAVQEGGGFQEKGSQADRPDDEASYGPQ